MIKNEIFSELQNSQCRVASILACERGSIMVIVLLILSLLTVLGLSSSKTSFTELQISSNQSIYKQNFLQADAAMNEGMQIFANLGADMGNTPPAWMLPATTALLPAVTSAALQNNEYAAVSNDVTWNQDIDGTPGPDNSFTSQSFANAQVMAVHRGIAPGSNLVLGSSRMHIFEFYGRSQQNNGTVILKAGYRQPY